MEHQKENTGEILRYLKRSKYYKKEGDEKKKIDGIFLEYESRGLGASVRKIRYLISEEHAEDLINMLDHRYDEFKRDNDADGMKHVVLIGEVLLNKARKEGKFYVFKELSRWVEKKRIHG